MKASRLLATLLLVALSTGFSSCEKSLELAPVDQVTEDSFYNDIDKNFAEYMDDFSNIKCRGALAGEGSMLLSGIKNKHLWFSEFDTTTKKLKSTWLDIEETDTIQQVHKGYGEYGEMKVEHVMLRYHQKTKTGNIVGFVLVDLSQPYRLSQTVFTSNGKSKRTEMETINNNLAYNEWYDESVLIGNNCYSSEGDPIYTIKEDLSFSIRGLEPISYEEGIKFDYYSFSFEKFNIKEGKSVWKTNLTDIKLPSDSKISYTILDKSANVWKYKVDAVLYNGTKHSYIFTVNIETGEVNVAEEGVKVTGVSLNESQAKLAVGETFKLTAIVQPANVENSKITWTSSNQSVATVDQNGLVTAKSLGEATITATTEDGGFTATSTITVKIKDVSDYITSQITASMINIGGLVEGVVGCEIINNSKEEIQLTNYSVSDDKGVVLIDEPYSNRTLKAGESYREDVRVKGVFKELTLRWTYVHNGKEYNYTVKYRVSNP